MWKLFFEICDVLCGLIPSREQRNYMRQVQLYDWRQKYNALRTTFPELNFHHTKMIKGGWNIGFIVDKKYVFKIRKQFDTKMPHSKISRQQRITNALRPYSPIHIPQIDIVRAGKYTFYRYEFIDGKNLNRMRMGFIKKYAPKFAADIAKFIYAIHNARPDEISDLITENGDGWCHNDLCNNIIIDPHKKQITGIIDWEYAQWDNLESEFNNLTRYSKKMQKSHIGEITKNCYKKY